MTLCEQYQAWARQAVEEWDGQDTAELFCLILNKTGEGGFETFKAAVHLWRKRNVPRLASGETEDEFIGRFNSQFSPPS